VCDIYCAMCKYVIFTWLCTSKTIMNLGFTLSVNYQEICINFENIWAIFLAKKFNVPWKMKSAMLDYFMLSYMPAPWPRPKDSQHEFYEFRCLFLRFELRQDTKSFKMELHSAMLTTRQRLQSFLDPSIFFFFFTSWSKCI